MPARNLALQVTHLSFSVRLHIVLTLSQVQEETISHFASLRIADSEWTCRANSDKLVFDFAKSQACISVSVWTTGCCDIIIMSPGDAERAEHYEFGKVEEAASQIAARLAAMLGFAADATY